MQVAKRTNVTQMLCVRTLTGRTFADAKKDMPEMVKTAQVNNVYDFKIFSKRRIRKSYLRRHYPLTSPRKRYKNPFYCANLQSKQRFVIKYKQRSFIIAKFADIDECLSSESNDCDQNAMCTNTEGSFVCRCKRGYNGDGKNCTGKNSIFCLVLDVKCLVEM